MARRRRKVYVHDFINRRGRAIGFNIRAAVGTRGGAHSRAHAYEACVTVNQQHGRAVYPLDRRRGLRSLQDREVCATGPAPRRALGAALKKLGATLVRRSSAFRGT